MKELHLRYKMDTAKSHEEEIDLSDGTYELKATDDYVEWLEERVAPNIEVIEKLRELGTKYQDELERLNAAIIRKAEEMKFRRDLEKELFNLKELVL